MMLELTEEQAKTLCLDRTVVIVETDTVGDDKYTYNNYREFITIDDHYKCDFDDQVIYETRIVQENDRDKNLYMITFQWRYSEQDKCICYYSSDNYLKPVKQVVDKSKSFKYK